MKRTRLLLSTVLIALSLIALFLDLGKHLISECDEAYSVNHVFEMMENGEWLVTYYHGEPEMGNTKPPLLLWLQLASMEVFGISEWSLRLPSAVAGFFTILLVFAFGSRFLGSWNIGFLAAMTLLCTHGFVNHHVTRTGDYDALLTLFMTFQVFSFYCYWQSKSRPYFWLFLFGLIASVYAKGMAGLFFIPGLTIWLLYQKEFRQWLLSKRIWFGILVALIGIGLFYFFREIQTPGYIRAVLTNEGAGKYLYVKGHPGYLFYVKELLRGRFVPWFLFLPLGVYLWQFKKAYLYKDILAYLSILSLWLFLFLSLSQTRFSWYIAPIYPLLALITGISMAYLYQKLSKHIQWSEIRRFSVFSLLLFGLIYASILYKVGYRITPARQNMKGGLAEKLRFPEKEKTIFISNCFDNAVRFYINKHTLTGGMPHFKSLDSLSPEDEVIICFAHCFEYLDKFHSYEQLDKWQRCKLVRIKD